VSSLKYKNLSCHQLEKELKSLNGATKLAKNATDKKLKTQNNKNVAAFLLFWPALFMIDDNKPEANKYAQIKGEFDTVVRTFDLKNCQ
jgi:hypothetical protein